MQVRYQAAPRPDRTQMIAQKGWLNLDAASAAVGGAPLASQYLDQLFQFQSHLMDQLLALVQIHLRIIAREPVTRAADGKPLLVEQAADLSNDQHILPLIIAAIAAALDRLELREFLLPVAQHMRLDAAQVADFTDGEVPLPRDRRQFAIVAWFQHTPRREPSISGPDGR